MGMMQEFKEFAVKGNVVDMAVGIIIGAAFGKIVSSFVADVIMPPIGVILGNVDFSDLAITLKEAAGEAPAVVLSYGKFIQTVVDFTIVAFAIVMPSFSKALHVAKPTLVKCRCFVKCIASSILGLNPSFFALTTQAASYMPILLVF